MKAKDFIKKLRENDAEAEIYCQDGHGYAVPADFGIVIFPSKAVFMVGPEKEARKTEYRIRAGKTVKRNKS